MDEQMIAGYLAILTEELVPAAGCTEPIALAYGAAVLRDTLGQPPQRVEAEVSGNIIKNAKSVVVPNTGGLRGIPAAIAAGIVAGDPQQKLQTLARVPAESICRIRSYAEQTPIRIRCADTPHILDISLTGYAGVHRACVRIADTHTNVVFLSRDDRVLKNLTEEQTAQTISDRSTLTVAGILEFANALELSRISDLLDQQIELNCALAQEGLRGHWGSCIGKTLLGDTSDPITDAKAWAAAGSDARMNGCELPAVILSGSGNQGITASVPVIRYAEFLGVGKDQLYRALLVSNLVTIHQKTGIGRLSAYCGAISAGVGAGAGIAYLLDGSFEAVSQTVSNALAILSGTICDGAKSSCAAKIASSVEAGILGYRLYREHHSFRGGEGILADDVEQSIRNIGILASQGMRETDRTILRIMTQS